MSSEVQTIVKKVKKLPSVVKVIEESPPIIEKEPSTLQQEEKKEEEWTDEDENSYRTLYKNLFTKKKSKIDLSIHGLHDILVQLQGTPYENIQMDELYDIVKVFKTTEELDAFLMKIWNFSE